ncbi:CCR4-NOT core DEDD RNase subunit [Malassezia japonica]|uniref:poly(A)-specific ribonuclease n=1 Tax=Malassezia japonica TaxID=223818 RepID=A0AAF0JA57_9BASI|nr:CCR4-NOT core DEDD RNase subunit [Malassezia japonica]WFD39148.1 CCR4-NOT core DEDD RNase subunit [Malassezia japonica]
MAYLRSAIENYPYVAMDTEFPGIVARPIGNFRGSTDYHYQTLRCNVDLLRLIQIGITVCDEQGNLPPDTCTWQFNFHFDVNNDMCAPDSLELLTKAGLDFDRHLHFGIDHEHFGEMLITSGLALFEDVKWISFHSGYDFGYLLKLVTCLPLPSHEYEFFELLHQWFPCVYDIKYLMRSCKTLKGGLQDVADDLQVSRIGQQHQAGSDSLLTASTFFKLRDRFFDGSIDDEKHLGCLYGFANTTSAVFLPSGSIVYQAHGVTTPGMQHAQAVVPTPLTPGSSAPLHSPMSSHVPAGRRAAEAA